MSKAEVLDRESVTVQVKKQTITKTRVPGISKVTGVRGVSYLVRVELPPDPLTGERRQESKTYRTMKEAEAEQTKRRADIKRGVAVETSKLTIAEVAAQWLNVKRPDLKPRTLEGYEATVERIREKIGSMPIQHMQPANIDSMYALLRAEGKSEDAVHRVHRRLLQLFDYATKRRILAVNPMHAIDAPTVRSEAATVLTRPQIGRFLAFAAHDAYTPLWLLLVQTGLRRGEALGMRWKDVDLDRGNLSVRQCVDVLGNAPHSQTPKSASALRTITLSPECITALWAHHTAATGNANAR